MYESTAHRDGSLYLLCKGQLPDPKKVGRTVPVSRNNDIFINEWSKLEWDCET